MAVAHFLLLLIFHPLFVHPELSMQITDGACNVSTYLYRGDEISSELDWSFKVRPSLVLHVTENFHQILRALDVLLQNDRTADLLVVKGEDNFREVKMVKHINVGVVVVVKVRFPIGSHLLS